MFTSQLINKMSEDLLLTKDKLLYLIRSAPYRYKTYYVKKRSGRGLRLIAQPAREVKVLQYWVMDKILSSFPVHKAATAYRKHINIKNNAEPHAANPFLLKLDFKDFFPSIKGHDFNQFISNQHNELLNDIDISLLTKILFWKYKGRQALQLSIGAPSSPLLSNIILYQFDVILNKYCESKNIAYTRYADDMTFSMQAKDERAPIISKINTVLSKMTHPKLQLNNSKTIFSSKANKRLVTGLIISNENTVTIGRNKKRLLRAQLHHCSRGRMSINDIDKLKGALAFVKSIEPDFVEKLLQKYNIKCLDDL